MSKKTLSFGFAVIGTILIPVHTKDKNVYYVTKVGTRKTFVSSRELNFPILLQSQSKRKPVNKPYHKRTSSHLVSATFKFEFESHRKHITVSINKIRVRFQFETASDVTLISRSTWEQLGKPDLLKTDHIASADENLLSGQVNCSVCFFLLEKFLCHMLRHRHWSQFDGSCLDRRTGSFLYAIQHCV